MNDESRVFCKDCEYFAFNHPELYLSFNFGWGIEHCEACKYPGIVKYTAERPIIGGDPEEINENNLCGHFLLYKKPIKNSWFKKLFKI